MHIPEHVLASLYVSYLQIYAIALIYLTQQLTLDRDLHRSVSLSAYSDKSTAWSGIGTALIVVWSQRKVRTAPLAIVLIVIYLACIFGLGLTTPAMVNVAEVTLNDTLYERTTYYAGKVQVSE